MSFSYYAKLAMRTCGCTTVQNKRAHGAMEIISEIGEIAGIMQKEYQGHPIDKDHFIKELGDLAWGMAEIWSTMGIKTGDDEDIEFSNPHDLLAYKRHNVQEEIICLAQTVNAIARNAVCEDPMSYAVAVTLIRKAVYSIGVLANYFESDIADVCNRNIEKLKSRYPEGFRVANSINRKEGDI